MTGTATAGVDPLETTTPVVLLSLAGRRAAAAVLLSCQFVSPTAADTCLAMTVTVAATAAVLLLPC